MEKKKILYIGNKLSKKGSTVTSIETLGKLLSSEGFTVFTASSFQNKPLRLLDMVWSVLKYSGKVSYILIDTYSTQNFWYAVTVARFSKWCRVPYIPILRGGNLPQRLQKSKARSQALFNDAHTNVAPSHYLLEAFTAAGFLNLVHIPNTIEIDKYTFLLRKEICPKLLWVRSFSEIYNPMLAISILKQLRKEGIDASLTMVGPAKDNSFEACKREAEKDNLPVTFTGKLDKQEWIKISEASDIFINTTNFDNTPISVIEAMALGMPVISTNVGGLPYLIDNDIDGLLVQPNNVEPFVSNIKRLLEDAEKAQEITIAARKKVAGFDWDVVKQQWISLLSQ